MNDIDVMREASEKLAATFVAAQENLADAAVTKRDNPFHPLHWEAPGCDPVDRVFVIPKGTSKKALRDSAGYMLHTCRGLLAASRDDLAGVPEGFDVDLTNAAHILATLALEQLQAAEVFG
jgi:hypothetical protein